MSKVAMYSMLVRLYKKGRQERLLLGQLLLILFNTYQKITTLVSNQNKKKHGFNHK